MHMFYTEFFFENTQQFNKKVSFRNSKYGKTIYYYHPSEFFAIEDFNQVIPFFETIRNNNIYKNLPIFINLGNIQFEDKLTFVILECLIEYLIKNDYMVFLNYRYKPMIHLGGLATSPLKILNTAGFNGKVTIKNKYLQKFQLGLSRTHFRKIIAFEKWNNDHSITSNLMQDIDSFFMCYNISKDYRASISEVVVELAENALEHSNSDCLIDLDITDRYSKTIGQKRIEGAFHGINIVVINFSKTLLGDNLQNKISEIDLNDPNSARYAYVYNAEKNHSKLYDDNYNKNDFYTIASFQHKISSRKDNINTGGTGLSKLLKSIEEKSDAYNCYVINGNSVLWFKHEYINTEQNEWIGFNDDNDFLNEIPSQNCFEKSSFYFPGTAYNLNFVLKLDNNIYRSENNETNN